MKFGKESVEKFHKFDVSFDKKEHSFLRDYGLDQIKNDDEALINYAVNKILREAVKNGEKQ